MPRNARCTDCTLHRMTGMRCVWGTGPSDARIMLVGEAPGAKEEQLGRPFVGSSGKTLNAALNDAGLRREQCYVTNTVRCRPPENRTPEQDEVNACLHYLVEEIDIVRPDVIVCLGNTALRALTGKRAVTTERGKPIPPRRGLRTEAVIYATYHPASTFREPSNYPKMVGDLRNVKRFLSGEQPEERQMDVGHTRLLFPPGSSDTEVIAALDKFEAARALFVDLEWTAGKGVRRIIWPWSNQGEAFSIGLTGRIRGNKPYSVGLSFPLSPAVHARLLTLLLKPLVFHNAMADGLWLRKMGFPDYHLRYDTMLLAYLQDETQQFNLEAVATRYAEGLEGGWKNHLFRSRPSTVDQWMELLTYNTDDTYATMLSFEGLWAALMSLPPERQKAIRLINDKILMPVLKILERATSAGVPINEGRLNEERLATEARRDAKAEKLGALIDMTPIQARKLALSPVRSVAFIDQHLGIWVPNSQKRTITELAEDYPAVQGILDIREENKLDSTYLTPWSRLLARQGDGALHGIWKLFGTGTGRLSMDGEMGGTLHTAPRDAWLRRLVEAPEGYVIVAGDYSMVELRVLAWIANEPTMLRLFSEGQDLHKATAAYLIACKVLGRIPTIGEWWPERLSWIDKVTKLDRDNAKPVNFGLCYSMAAEGLQAYAREAYGVKMTMVEAMQMHAGYFTLYSGLPDWHAMKRETVGRSGEDITVFGRRRQYNETNMNACINTPIQSTASDFTLLALPQIDTAYTREKVDGMIIGTIHDSILVLARERDAEQASVLMKYEMEHVNTSAFGFEIPIPLPADVHYGKTWVA